MIPPAAPGDPRLRAVLRLGVDLEGPLGVAGIDVGVAVLAGEVEGPVEHGFTFFEAVAIDAPIPHRSEAVVEFAEPAELSGHPFYGDLRRSYVVGDPRAAVDDHHRAHVTVVVGDEDPDPEAFNAQGEGELTLHFGSALAERAGTAARRPARSTPTETRTRRIGRTIAAVSCPSRLPWALGSISSREAPRKRCSPLQRCRRVAASATAAGRRAEAAQRELGGRNRPQPQVDAVYRGRTQRLSEPAFDELLRRLSAAGVEFVVVGGLAVNAWGVVRGTKDVDVVVDPAIENLKRVAEVAVAAGGHVQQGDALLGSPNSIAAALGNGEQVAIETDLGRLDVVQGLAGVPEYDELRLRAGKAEILGVTVLVCSIEDLKAMKRATGRTRDLADLEDLDAAGS